MSDENGQVLVVMRNGLEVTLNLGEPWPQFTGRYLKDGMIVTDGAIFERGGIAYITRIGMAAGNVLTFPTRGPVN